MRKNIKLVIIIVVILILSVVGTYQLAKKITANKDPRQIMTNDERRTLNLYHLGNYEVISRDTSGKVDTYHFINLNQSQPLKLEWMTEEEKTKIGLDISAQGQVLERDSQGKVMAYRVIYKDEDIITEY